MTIASVRVVVVTHCAGERLRRCIEHLVATQWPADQLDIVIIDNASTDNSVSSLPTWANVRVISAESNLGFGGGVNLALQDLAGVDAVALINDDAYVTKDWLKPLASALDDDLRRGAACPKILLTQRFGLVELASDDTVLELLGPSSIRPISGAAQVEPGRWLTNGKLVRVAVPFGESARLVVGAPRPLVLHINGAPTQLVKGTNELAITAFAQSVDLINSVGNELTADYYVRDRGFCEVDRGQFDRPGVIWGWSGGAVLLSAQMLREIGTFDSRFFLYYEDVDLAWRARSRGWIFCSEPRSVVRHDVGASLGSTSPLFDRLNRRNRLVVIARYAGIRIAIRVWCREFAEAAWFTGKDGLAAVRQGSRQPLRRPARRWWAFGGATRLVLSGSGRETPRRPTP